MSEIMEHFWRTQSCKKGLRLLSLSKICTPKKNGGLNILNIHVHALARKATLLPTFILQYQPWSQMMAFMSSKIKTSSYGNWHFLAWEVTFGKVQGYIPGYPYTSHLLSDWKLVTKHAVWRGRPGPQGNSLRIENIHWSAIFSVALEPRKSYFVSRKNIITIGDVVDDHGMVISFPNAVARFGIGLHYRSLWHLIQNMLLPISPIPPLLQDQRYLDWLVMGVPLMQIAAKHVYSKMQPSPWIIDHCNALWHLQKPTTWWRKRLHNLWKSDLPLKERLFLWRCLVGILPVGSLLAARSIASASCIRCHRLAETPYHLLWACQHSYDLIGRVFDCLRLRYPAYKFGKQFWLFGIVPPTLGSSEIFFMWVRFCLFWEIYNYRN